MVYITLALIENLATPGHNSNCSMQKELHIYKVLRSRQSMCLLLFSAMLACHDWMILCLLTRRLFYQAGLLSTFSPKTQDKYVIEVRTSLYHLFNQKAP